jgi:hypothetical protein
MIVPTVHMNGTKGDDLVEQLMDAREALRLAVKALQNAAPNGRDYYPQGPGAINEAIEQHSRWRQSLDDVYRELGSLAEAIADQS